MKVKVRKRKPAPAEPEQVKFKSTIEILKELVPEYGIPKMVWFERLGKEKSGFLTHDIKGNRRLKSETIEPVRKD